MRKARCKGLAQHRLCSPNPAVLAQQRLDSLAMLIEGMAASCAHIASDRDGLELLVGHEASAVGREPRRLVLRTLGA